MSYPFPKRPEQQILAAALLESICRDVEKRCEEAQKEWAVECEQRPSSLQYRKINEHMRTIISQRMQESSIVPRNINKLADSLLFYFPGCPDSSLEIIRQRTRGLAKQLVVQAAVQMAQQRLHQKLVVLTTAVAN